MQVELKKNCRHLKNASNVALFHLIFTFLGSLNKKTQNPITSKSKLQTRIKIDIQILYIKFF